MVLKFSKKFDFKSLSNQRINQVGSQATHVLASDHLEVAFVTPLL